jgi:hypothetical protein
MTERAGEPGGSAIPIVGVPGGAAERDERAGDLQAIARLLPF